MERVQDVGTRIAKLLVALTLQLACREGSVGHSETNVPGREPEQRCRDLGAGCYCAEALDFAGPVPASTFFDSPDSRSKECTQVPPPPWRPVYLRLGGEGVVPGGRPGPPPVPAGATLRHVLRETGSGGADHVTNHLLTDGSGGTLDLTQKTICFRAYIHYSEDHPPPGNVKIARLGDASKGMAWQSGWGGHLETSRSGSGYDHPPQIGFTADFDADGSVDVDCPLDVASTGDLLVFRDCQSHWCRYEICADHSASSPPAVRGRWLQIGGPRRSGRTRHGSVVHVRRSHRRTDRSVRPDDVHGAPRGAGGGIHERRVPGSLPRDHHRDALRSELLAGSRA